MSARWQPAPRVCHGAHGWQLEEMDWDPETGIATFLYRNADGRVTTEVRPQPTREGHRLWEEMSQYPYEVFSL